MKMYDVILSKRLRCCRQPTRTNLSSSTVKSPSNIIYIEHRSYGDALSLIGYTGIAPTILKSQPELLVRNSESL